jgi:hypothetical protein
MNQIVACPEPGCEVAAEVVSRWVWPSTDGPVEHVKLFCLHGHARTMLTAWLVTPGPLGPGGLPVVPLELGRGTAGGAGTG